MPETRKLDEDEVRNALGSLDGWSVVDGKLHKELQFADFNTAFGFIARVALVAESMNHHPEWSNVYNRVTIDLTTHDVGGISDRDLTLAGRVDELSSS